MFVRFSRPTQNACYSLKRLEIYTNHQYGWHFCKYSDSKPKYNWEKTEKSEKQNLLRSSIEACHGLPMSSSDTDRIDFANHQEAFKYRTTSEILRSYAILKLCGISYFTKNCLKLAKLCRKILGKRLYEYLMKMTFYGQFVAGEREDEISKRIAMLHTNRIRCMIACPTEDEAIEHLNSKEKYNRCMKKALYCIYLSGKYQPELAMTQIKISGLMPIDVLKKLKNLPEVETLSAIHTISQIMKEDSNQVNNTLLKIFNTTEFDQLKDGIRRLKQICEDALKKNVTILVDAEYISINPGIALLTLAMMNTFNDKRALVWLTYQCYLKSAYEDLARDVSIAEQLNVCFGAKIVRGAYLNQERELSKLYGYMDPINDSYEDTSAMYHWVANYMIDYIKEHQNRCQIVIATHNENAVKFSLAKLKEAGISHKEGLVTFAQLYGMCDQISYSLAQNNYVTYKSVPFGPVDDVLPYLHRRAMENVDVLFGSRREVQLLRNEIKNRMKRLLL